MPSVQVAMDAARLEARVREEVSSSQGHVRGVSEISKAAQRCRGSDAVAVLFLRARSLLALADEYTETAWQARGPRARRFYCTKRGLQAGQGIEALPDYRRLYLRTALAAAERAQLLRPQSLECAVLLACILWAQVLLAGRASEVAERTAEGTPAAVVLTPTLEAQLRALRRLHAVCDAGLALCADTTTQLHAADARELYGEHVCFEANLAERRSLLSTLRSHAVEQMPAGWDSWSSPWEGLRPEGLLE